MAVQTVTLKEWHRMSQDTPNGTWEIIYPCGVISVVVTNQFNRNILRQQYRKGCIELTTKYVTNEVVETIEWNTVTGLVSGFSTAYADLDSRVPINSFAYYPEQKTWYNTQIKIINGKIESVVDMYTY